MPTYDSLGTPSQLGADLQNYSSNGWPVPVPPNVGARSQVIWETSADFSPGASGFLPAQPRMTDACFHSGALHVVWVEPQYDSGSGRVRARGPFVAKWTGSAWSALGGEVEPSLVPADIYAPGYEDLSWENPGAPSSSPPWTSFTAGDIILPSRPRIASDGTNLYVAYAARVVDVSPDQPGSTTTEDDFREATGGTIGSPSPPYLWAPRWVFVRKWNGSSWDLFGQIQPSTNNGKWSFTASNTDDGGFGDVHLAASSAEAGVCYASLQEAGPIGACLFIDLTGGGGGYREFIGQMLIVRFDGSTTTGTIKTIVSNVVPAATTITSTQRVNAAVQPMAPIAMDNSTGDLIFFRFVPFVGTPAAQSIVMQRWSDLAVLQTTPLTSDDYVYTIALGAGTSLYYFQPVTHDFGSGTQIQTVFQVPKTGSTAIQPLDILIGLADAPEWMSELVPDDAHDGIWTVSTAELPDYGGLVYLYHRECPAWTSESVLTSALRDYSPPFLLMSGNTLYGGTDYYNPSSGSQDLVVQVFQAAICRGCESCVSADTVLMDLSFEAQGWAGATS